jgi:hypothetical protein
MELSVQRFENFFYVGQLSKNTPSPPFLMAKKE